MLFCFQAEDGIRDTSVTGVQTCALPIYSETVKLFVRDNGCGMSADEITIALEPLNQVDSGLTRPAEGAGMGLSLAGLLIQLQGGGLQIDSTPGEGTTVNIELRSSQPAPVK